MNSLTKAVATAGLDSIRRIANWSPRALFLIDRAACKLTAVTVRLDRTVEIAE